jgi:hypothetical protein
MPDVSPKPSSAEQPRNVSSERAARLREAAAALQQAIADLTDQIVDGGRIRRDDARDRFEMALADFSALIDQTAE